MEWLDLLAPSAAVLAVFAAIGLIVQSVRHGRAIRRLEDRLAERGEASSEAPLQRIAELQARAGTSPEGGESGGGGLRAGLAVLGIVAALVIAAGAVWYAFVRDDGGGATAAGGATTEATTASRPPTPPRDPTLVPENVPPLQDKSLYTVTVFNASGVDGAALNTVGPMVQAEGYTLGLVANPPDGTSDLARSRVMYAEGRRRVGQNVANDLDIDRAGPVDGLTTEQIGDADAVVIVGRDIAGTP